MYFHLALSVQGPAAWPAVPLICLCLLKAVSVRVKLPAVLSHSYFEGGEHKPTRSPSYWSCFLPLMESRLMQEKNHEGLYKKDKHFRIGF